MSKSNGIGSLVFTPATVTEWFGIPRSTLFAWERRGEIDKTERGPRGERLYRWSQIRQIAARAREQIGRDIELAAKENPDGLYPTEETLERLHRVEFFGGDEPEHGLEQLRGVASQLGLSPEICKVLLKEAQIRPRGDNMRTAILQLLLLDASPEP